MGSGKKRLTQSFRDERQRERDRETERETKTQETRWNLQERKTNLIHVTSNSYR